jgi:predicted methyltransferase
MIVRASLSALALVALAALVACGASSSTAPAASAPRAATTTTTKPDFRRILAAPDRSAEDRALDDGRRPAELFSFAGVQPGMRVAEIGAWKGYTAELLARAVAPNGKVYASDPAEFDPYTRDAWAERAKREPFARIVRVARPYDDPLPPDTAGTLDVVFVVLFYHDMVWLKVDRAKMNAALFRALKPGGTLVIADHSARANEGVSVAKSLHRIEESVVREEVAKAGFVLTAETDLLRHPEDARDWSASDEAPADKRGKSDRFVLRFKRP